MNLKQLEEIQNQLAQKVIVAENGAGYLPKDNDLVFTLDIQYEENKAYVAIDVKQWNGNCIGMYVAHYEAEVEYVSGYFAFREGPLLLKAIKALQTQHSLYPSLIIVDGHGLAHPRRFGVACWLGTNLDVPTIGFAKRTLIKYKKGVLENPRGSSLGIVHDDGDTVGYALRTQKNIKPVFVSVGHKISLQQAADIILELSPNYRICEPIRRADRAARDFALGEDKDWIVL